jgi:hypothetical protein
MLTFQPALPLIIDYGDEGREVTAQDEEGMSLAFQRRRRVLRARLWMPAPSLRRLLATMDGKFPMLEHLYIKPLTNDDNDLALPVSFHAPHLRHFVVRNTFFPPFVFRPPPPIPHIPSTEKSNQSASYHGPRLWRYASFCAILSACELTRSMDNRLMKMFVHMLDDDSLLNIFHFCRPVMIDEAESDIARILQGGMWDRERWWYKLTHVCRRWRCLILASASHLNLCLVCRPGTPVSVMLTNSPPLPLIIDHIRDNGSITAEDEAGIMLALQHRDRVRRIRLEMPLLNLQKLVPAIDEEFPMLEYLYIVPPTKCDSWLILPNTFQAPHLRHLVLLNFNFSIASPLITTSTSIVTLSLQYIPQSAFSHPNDLLQQLSLMPQLETLGITFHSPVPNRDLERQLIHRPVMTRVILPNLRWLGLRASSNYMEAVLSRMTTPLLERLQARFFLQLNFSVPHLLEFMGAAQNLRFRSAKFQFFDDFVEVEVYPRDDAPMFSFHTGVFCRNIDWQVSFAAQISRTLRTVFSTVEHLTLDFQRYFESSEANEADRTQWRELLGSFSNVKILCVNDFHGQISRSLQVDDGEPPLELLPELKELRYTPLYEDVNTFAFIDARQDAGRPVTLVR